MKATRWLFNDPARFWGAVGATAIAVLTAAVLTLAMKVSDLSVAEGGSVPTPAPIATGDGERLATPAPGPSTEAFNLPDQSITTRPPPAFPDAGDPRAVAIEAVNEWLTQDFRGLEDNLLPGVLEEAIANPPPRGVRVDGPAKNLKTGPTAATVRVPTTSGSLLVDLVTYDGKWMIEAMGWAA